MADRLLQLFGGDARDLKDIPDVRQAVLVETLLDVVAAVGLVRHCARSLLRGPVKKREPQFTLLGILAIESN